MSKHIDRHVFARKAIVIRLILFIKFQVDISRCMLCFTTIKWFNTVRGPSWSWSYCNWIYNYLCHQCLSQLTLWVRTPLNWGVLDTTVCDKVCQLLAEGRWFSPGTPVSSTNATDRRDITEMLLKVALNTITLTRLMISMIRKNKAYVLHYVLDK